MYYEINVARNGMHFFATAERSIQGAGKAREVYDAMCTRFLPEDGYTITVTKYEKYGQQVKME